MRILEMPDRSQLGTFVTKYDSIQDDLDTLAAMDDLLAGGEDGDQSCENAGEDLVQLWSPSIINFLCRSAKQVHGPDPACSCFHACAVSAGR